LSKDITKKKNTQDKLQDYADSVPGDNKNQNHNAKNIGLGQNIRRKG